ncbi:hypothetical protein LX36DRAFT_675760 [Colletotrichum falcatum]|nr:hypothetical protein LX36DRAFT_675760 [Colletotrichum falcatum]
MAAPATLPAPITHTQFEQEASQWNFNIRNYLDNHADLTVDLSSVRGQRLLAIEQLNTLAGHDAPWHRLLRDKTSRYNAMRMLIARIIANRVDPETSVETSLLPRSVLRAYQDIVAGGKQNLSVLGMQNVWRAVTMNLVLATHQTSTAASLAASSRFPSIQETATIIRSALAPLLLRQSKPGADSEAYSLVDVVAKGALLGMRMFEQNNPTRFFWQSGDESRDRSSKDSLIVFPGIKQRSMEPGSKEPRRESVIAYPVRA